MEAKDELVDLLKSAQVKGYYGKALSLIGTISSSDPEYLLNLAKSLRANEETRLLAIWLLVETAIAISTRNSGLPESERTSLSPVLAQHVPEITTEIEDVLRAIGYCTKRIGSKSRLPQSLKRGLRKSLEAIGKEKMDQFDSGKKRCDVTLNDALKILHPRFPP